VLTDGHLKEYPLKNRDSKRGNWEPNWNWGRLKPLKKTLGSPKNEKAVPKQKTVSPGTKENKASLIRVSGKEKKRKS